VGLIICSYSVLAITLDCIVPLRRFVLSLDAVVVVYYHADKLA
jgi:hypothetical protein